MDILAIESVLIPPKLLDYIAKMISERCALRPSFPRASGLSAFPGISFGVPTGLI